MRTFELEFASGKKAVVDVPDKKIKEQKNAKGFFFKLYDIFDQEPEEQIIVIREKGNNITTYDKRFECFANAGQRIEVTYEWGEKERFYVGRSTGWIPCYIGIKRIDSIGGMAISTDAIIHIKPLPKYTRLSCMK